MKCENCNNCDEREIELIEESSNTFERVMYGVGTAACLVAAFLVPTVGLRGAAIATGVNCSKKCSKESVIRTYKCKKCNHVWTETN